jgi:hypothetical protein
MATYACPLWTNTLRPATSSGTSSNGTFNRVREKKNKTIEQQIRYYSETIRWGKLILVRYARSLCLNKVKIINKYFKHTATFA